MRLVEDAYSKDIKTEWITLSFLVSFCVNGRKMNNEITNVCEVDK